MSDASRSTCGLSADAVCRRRDMRMTSFCTMSELGRTCSRDNTTTSSSDTRRPRRCCRDARVLTALTLPLFVVVSLLRPAVAHVPRAGVRPRCVDAPSRTIQADAVLEGRVERLTSDDAVMVVRVLAVFKGRRLRRQATSRPRLRVAVDFGSLADTFTVDDDDDDDHVGCVTSPTSPAAGQRLIIFLRHQNTEDAMLTYYVTSGGRRRRRKVDLYRMSALPAAVNEKTRQTARKYSKRRNTRRPRVLITSGDNEEGAAWIEDGCRLVLRCRASGRPQPDVTWLKDGQSLHNDNALRIRHTRRGSVLRVRRVTTSRDTGQYQCVASNVVGTARSAVLIVTALSSMPEDSTVKPHSVPCQNEGFCLNGGTCYHFESLDRDYCVCAEGFDGSRCAVKVPVPVFNDELTARV